MKRYGPRTYVHEAPLVLRTDGGWVLYKDVRIMIEYAQEVARLLELGDQRLLTSDGSCGGQNAVAALSSKESAKLYQTCQKIAAEAVGS